MKCRSSWIPSLKAGHRHQKNFRQISSVEGIKIASSLTLFIDTAPAQPEDSTSSKREMQHWQHVQSRAPRHGQHDRNTHPNIRTVGLQAFRNCTSPRSSSKRSLSLSLHTACHAGLDCRIPAVSTRGRGQGHALARFAKGQVLPLHDSARPYSGPWGLFKLCLGTAPRTKRTSAILGTQNIQHTPRPTTFFKAKAERGPKQKRKRKLIQESQSFHCNTRSCRCMTLAK